MRICYKHVFVQEEDNRKMNVFEENAQFPKGIAWMNRKKKWAAALLFLLPLFGLFAESTNLLPDPTLTDARRWPSQKGYRLAPGEGRSGANALIYERKNPNDYPLPGIGVKLAPGSYEFGGWVYCERGETGEVGAAICMEMSENGKYAGGSFRAQRKGPADWRLIHAILIVPENRKLHIQFVPYMQKGYTGRVKFSDMYIRRANPVIYASVLEPRMPHALLPGKNRLLLGITVMNTPRKDSVLHLVLSGKNGITAEKSVPNPPQRMTQEFNFPDAGNYSLECTLRDLTGKLLASDRIPLAVPPQPVSVSQSVTLDRKGRMLVNGKKFFPVGIFTNRNKTAKHLPLLRELQLLADGGFNCILPYDGLEYRMPEDKSPDKEEALRKVLDHLQKLNLKMLPSLDYVRKSDLPRMRRIVTKLRNHPAVLSWYLYDEPPLREREKLRKLCRELNLLDPRHPLTGVSLMADGSALYAGTSNIYAFDNYPIYGNTENISGLSRGLKQFHDGIASGGGASFWFVPQWFSWECYASTRSSTLYRWPTLEESAAMSLLSIIHGAKGLLFYSFFDMFKFGDFEKQWPQLRRLVKMMNDFVPFALGDDPGMNLKVVRQSGNLVFRSFRSDDGRDAVALVSLGGRGELILRLPGTWKSTTGKTRMNNDGTQRFSSDAITCDILYHIK